MLFRLCVMACLFCLICSGEVGRHLEGSPSPDLAEGSVIPAGRNIICRPGSGPKAGERLALQTPHVRAPTSLDSLVRSSEELLLSAAGGTQQH